MLKPWCVINWVYKIVYMCSVIDVQRDLTSDIINLIKQFFLTFKANPSSLLAVLYFCNYLILMLFIMDIHNYVYCLKLHRVLYLSIIHYLISSNESQLSGMHIYDIYI